MDGHFQLYLKNTRDLDHVEKNIYGFYVEGETTVKGLDC